MTHVEQTCAWAVEQGEDYTRCYGWECAKTKCYRKARAAQQRKTALSGYRKFPGAPHVGAGRAHCAWCGQPIVHGRVSARGWHDGRLDEPDCVHELKLRTDVGIQMEHLLGRDGYRCRGCGELKGGWQHDPRFSLARRMEWWPAGYPADVYVGEASFITHWCSMQVDHVVSLAVAAQAFIDDKRWPWFFSPANLQLLCHGCHVIKTRADVQALKMVRKMPQEEKVQFVLGVLACGGRLKGAA